MSNYIVCRVGRLTRKDLIHTRRHNDRTDTKHRNPDIDPARSHLNLELVPNRKKVGYGKMFDQMIAEGKISTSGLKSDAVIMNEILHDVNSEYWLSYKEHGFESAEEFADSYFNDCFEFDKKKFGEDMILSAVVHKDEVNKDLTEKYGFPVIHYHMHTVAIPTVIKEKKWSKRCKDPSLVGKVKERITQVSESKFWAFENGRPSYAILQDEVYDHLQRQGWADLERGEEGSEARHVSAAAYKKAKDQLKEMELNIMEKGKSLETAQQAIAAAENELDRFENTLEGLKTEIAESEETLNEYETALSEYENMSDLDMRVQLFNLQRENERLRAVLSSLKEKMDKFITNITTALRGANLDSAADYIQRHYDMIFEPERKQNQKVHRHDIS